MKNIFGNLLCFVCTITALPIFSWASCYDIAAGKSRTPQILTAIKNRLVKIDPKLAARFDYQMMELPTVREARAKRMLPPKFLKSIESNTFEGDEADAIPFDAKSSDQFVTMYRLVGFITDYAEFDAASNYKKAPVTYGSKWTGDFVTDKLSWTWVYGAKNGGNLLIKYKIPANLLDIDLTTHRQEPYYVISKVKLRAVGLENPNVFIEKIAYVAGLGNNWPDSLNDPRIKWLSAAEVKSIRER